VIEVEWTIKSVLNWTHKYFEKKRPCSPRLDAELLLAFVLGCPRLDLYLRADQPLNKKELGLFKKLVKQRSIGCPIAYLTGEKEFWSLALEVNKNTLIPRPDTEILVENAVIQIAKWQEKHPEETCKIAEIGTGTAAIPLALCAELKNLEIIAVDYTPEILEVASRNLERHKSLLNPRKNDIQLLMSDLFSKISTRAKLDFIVSNPPYIPSNKINNLQVEVSQYEPRIALDGGHDGLDFYRYLLKNAPNLLVQDGEMLLEIGFFEENELISLQKSNIEWKSSEFMNDLRGHIRVWKLSKK